MLYSVLNSKQEQLHGHKSNKMRESTLSWFGNFKEKINLSHIYIAVHKEPNKILSYMQDSQILIWMVNIGCAFLILSLLYFFHIKIAFFCLINALSISHLFWIIFLIFICFVNQPPVLNYFSDLYLLFIPYKSKNAHICFTSLICNN